MRATRIAACALIAALAAAPALADSMAGPGRNGAVDNWNTNAFARTPNWNTNAFGAAPDGNTNAFGSRPPANESAFGTNGGRPVTAFGNGYGPTTNAFGNRVAASHNADRLAGAFRTGTTHRASPIGPPTRYGYDQNGNGR